MDLRHYHQAQRRHEDTIWTSTIRQQQRSAMTLPVLPSSTTLWQSLRLQLLMELQRLAREKRMTVIEMQEFLLMPTASLTRAEWCWLEQLRNLLAVMPRDHEETWYDLSSYLLRVIHPLVARPPPSTLIGSTDLLPLTARTSLSTAAHHSPLTSTSLTDPILLTLTTPHQPTTGSSISNEPTAPLPH